MACSNHYKEVMYRVQVNYENWRKTCRSNQSELTADPTADYLSDEDLNVLLCLLVFADPVTLYKANFMYGLLM